MKILLINPIHMKGFCESLPPLGLMYVSSYIKSKGYKDVSIIDLDLMPGLASSIEKEIKNADIIGVSAFTTQFNHAREISDICKKYAKLSVVGGVHVTPIPSECLKNSNFDIAVKGEGEVTLLDIIKAVENNSSLGQIEGISYKKNAQIIENRDRPFIETLDELPFPDHNGVPLREYKAGRDYFKGHYSILITSRGCPAECVFCQSPVSWKRKTRFRSAENVFAEITRLYQDFGFRNLFFEDDTFTLREDRVADLCNMIIKSGMDLKWACGTRPTALSPQILALMKKAGCVRISIGAENGNPEILKSAKKGYTIEQIRNSFSLVQDAKISNLCYMMIGLPGENFRTIINSIKFARSLKADQYQWTVVVPFPGTELFKNKELDIFDYDYNRWTYWSPVIRIKGIGPARLKIIQRFAEIITKKEHHGLVWRRACFHVIVFHLFQSLVKDWLRDNLSVSTMKFVKKALGRQNGS